MFDMTDWLDGWLIYWLINWLTNQQTNQLTNYSMEYIPSWEEFISLWEILPVLWKPNVHFRIHNSLLLVPILSQIDPTQFTAPSILFLLI